MWGENTYPFPNFSGCTVEVWKWINNFIPHFTVHVIIYPCWDKSQSMSVPMALSAKRSIHWQARPILRAVSRMIPTKRPFLAMSQMAFPEAGLPCNEPDKLLALAISRYQHGWGTAVDVLYIIFPWVLQLFYAALIDVKYVYLKFMAVNHLNTFLRIRQMVSWNITSPCG